MALLTGEGRVVGVAWDWWRRRGLGERWRAGEQRWEGWEWDWGDFVIEQAGGKWRLGDSSCSGLETQLIRKVTKPRPCQYICMAWPLVGFPDAPARVPSLSNLGEALLNIISVDRLFVLERTVGRPLLAVGGVLLSTKSEGVRRRMEWPREWNRSKSELRESVARYVIRCCKLAQQNDG